MARTERDRWDLATSVGATATMVAAQRALSSDAKLIDDPYAAPLVRAVGIDVYVRLVNGEIAAGGNTEFDPQRMAQGMACRTRFYDQFFLDATRSGVGQVVILASGLDSRAYRLPWPAGTVVYEVDMPEVIEFKTLTLGDLGAEPTAERRTVAIDLRDDWAAALQAAGHELYVVAPVTEQSWTGASKTRQRPVRSAVADHGFGCPTWTVDGTPSDCVNIALAHLLPTKVDAVVSGMNVGFNCTLGFILASGTVAGAWEGALHGLPALAVSQDVSEKVYNYLKDHGGTPDAELLATLRLSFATAGLDKIEEGMARLGKALG